MEMPDIFAQLLTHTETIPENNGMIINDYVGKGNYEPFEAFLKE